MPEDLSVFFQDSLVTVSVVFGAVSTSGILDEPDVVVGGGMAESTSYSLLVKTEDFPTVPKFGDSITVNSIAFIVNTFMKIDDGKLARIGLSKAS